MGKNKRKDKKRKPSMAERADRHVLYQESVQCVEAEIDFVDDTFNELRGRRAVWLREDFCGTANTSCEWVRRHPANHAVSVDWDAKVLDWGRQHNVAALTPDQQGRIELINADVLTVATRPLDAVLAMNFSYWIFKTRDTMRRYFETVRAALVTDGILFLDAYGGYDAFRVLRERTDFDDFSYIWDQASYNPINGEMTCHIHFKFKDGSQLKKAFSYEWRLWTLPEVREILAEAGFARSTVYWQGWDEDSGEGDGEFNPTEVGEPDAGWIAYLVAEK